MSYDISLIDPITQEILELDFIHDIKGGTYAIGGTNLATINITWNYAPIFYKVLGKKGIRTIYGKTGKDSIPIINTAMKKLNDDIDLDYWKPTEGNVKQALKDLLFFAQQKPNGVWNGD